MPKSGDDELQATPRAKPVDRAETIATLVALAWVSVVAILFAVFGGNVSLVGLLAIGPFIAAPFARPSRVAFVGLLAAFFALVISTPPHSYGELNHTLRVLTQLAATALAMWISYLRGQRNVQLWTARSETRTERRRRVAAETAQRLQTMARALTTAADPAQVADAVFAALRDELHVDAATFALLDERGRLQTLRRFGYDPDAPIDSVLPTLQPDGPVLGQNVAFFAESLEVLRRQRPDLHGALGGSPFRALGDRPAGRVRPHDRRRRRALERGPRGLGSRPQFPLSHHGYRGAGRRAGTPDGDGVREPRTDAAPAPAELGPRGRDHPGRCGPCSHRGVPARVGCPLRRGTDPRLRGTCAVLPRQQRAPCPPVPRRWCPSTRATPARAFVRGRTDVVTLGAVADLGRGHRVEVVPRVLEELAEPVTIVTEPLVGSIGPLGVLSLAFVGQPEPSEPDLRFLSTLAGLTAQALERAQVFEHEREALRLAEAGRERLSLLSEVTRLLSSSLEPTTVIRRTMSLVEGRLADSCVVQVPGENGLVRLDVREPARPGRSRRPRADRRGRPVRLRGAGRDRLPHRAHSARPLEVRGRRVRSPGHRHRLGRPPDRQRRGHRRHDLRGRSRPGLRGGRRVARHRGGQPCRRRPLQRDPVPARARGGRSAPARRAARLAPDRRCPGARRRVPGRCRRHLRRRRLVRRLRARRRHRLLQCGRRHGQGGARRRAHGQVAARSAPMRSPACRRPKCSPRSTACSTPSSRTAW